MSGRESIYVHLQALIEAHRTSKPTGPFPMD